MISKIIVDFILIIDGASVTHLQLRVPYFVIIIVKLNYKPFLNPIAIAMSNKNRYNFNYQGRGLIVQLQDIF